MATETTPTPKPKAGKKKERKNVPFALAHIQATFNNTIITITDPNGSILCWGSSGAAGFKGSKKSTPFAAEVAASSTGRKAAEHGVRTLDIEVRGPGAGREAAIRALQSSGIKVNSIRDVTPIPHNGCRPRKRRRV
ncbi:MAG: 30S ribosomal protein S11 [Pseudomonadota bacterium]